MCFQICLTQCSKKYTRRCLKCTLNTKLWKASWSSKNIWSAVLKVYLLSSNWSWPVRTLTIESRSGRSKSIKASVMNVHLLMLRLLMSAWNQKQTFSVRQWRSQPGIIMPRKVSLERHASSCAAGLKSGVRRKSLNRKTSAASANRTSMKVRQGPVFLPLTSITNLERLISLHRMLRQSTVG